MSDDHAHSLLFAADSAVSAVLDKTAALLPLAAEYSSKYWPGAYERRRVGLYPYHAGLLVVDLDSVVNGRASAHTAKVVLPGEVPFTWVPSWAPAALLPSGISIAVSVFPPTAGMEVRDSVRLTLRFALHELFHVYQREVFTPSRWDERHEIASDSLARASWLGTAVGDSLLAQERTALERAVSSRTKQQVNAALKDYTKLRERRSRTASVLVYEAEKERIEGVAEYVAFAATNQTLRFPSDSLRTDILRWLRAPQLSLRRADYTGNYIWWHIYAVGIAKAYLADRYISGWREAVAHGSSLDSILTVIED